MVIIWWAWIGAFLAERGVEEPLPPPEYGTAGAFLYEEGSIHAFDIRLDPAAMHDADRVGADDVHATVSYRGESWDVGLHLKGSSTFRHLDGKPSFKIDFGEWIEDQTLYGVRRLTLNNMVFDESMLREHGAYRLFSRMGVPAPRHGYARVSLNGEPLGLYGIVESMDKHFLTRMFPSNDLGNLYDPIYATGDVSGLGVANFGLQAGEPVEPFADLRALVDEIDRSGDILDVIERRFDAERLLTMIAVDLAIAQWDGYSRNSNNYLLYHALPADRWYMIPWGQDQAFRGGGHVYLGLVGRLAVACRQDRACADRLDAHVAEVIEVWEGEDLAGYLEETADTIGTDCWRDPRSERECDFERVLEAAVDRPRSVRHDLGM